MHSNWFNASLIVTEMAQSLSRYFIVANIQSLYTVDFQLFGREFFV